MQDEIYVLDNFECFNECEDAYLKVTPKSNLYCLFFGNVCRVAWEKIDSISVYNEVCIEYEKSYFDVISNEELLSITEYKGLNVEESRSKLIVPLCSILKLNEDEEKYLTINDIKYINSYKDHPKSKVLKLGKKNVTI